MKEWVSSLLIFFCGAITTVLASELVHTSPVIPNQEHLYPTGYFCKYWGVRSVKIVEWVN